jgi:outer membrane protein, heavy metal efflux system
MRTEKVKTTILALAITSAFGLTAFAQSSNSSAKSEDSTQCMEGMAMPGCPQADKQHHQHSIPIKPEQTAQPQQPKPQNDMGNMPGMPPMQHDMSGMQMGTPQQSQSPDTHATMTLQEPENPDRKTGSNLPAPELLKDVAARTPMALADFQALADANNPTLRQANALVRRSQEQARQAGLYPNPSIGYQGEQIRGGSYGGENRAALSNRLSFSAANSGCAATSTTSRRDQIRSAWKSKHIVFMAMSNKRSMMR